MKPEQPREDSATPPADPDHAPSTEVGTLLDAVERDVAAGKPIADALRERFGVVLAPSGSAEQGVPVDEATLRDYIGGSLPPDEQKRIHRLIWEDPAWRGAYLQLKYPPRPGA
jgi:hypothetical protein